MAFAHFEERRAKNPEAAQAFDNFCREQSPWLYDYTLFRALMEKNRGRETWDSWPEEQRSAAAARAWLEAIGPSAPEEI